MRSGQFVVLGIVAIALIATGSAWLHHRGQGHHALEFWGSENALLVRRATNVQLKRLERDPTNSVSPLEKSTVNIDGENYVITKMRDVSEAKGLIHCRQALIFDPSYDWTQTPSADGEWRYALSFANNKDDKGALVVLFDPESKLVRHGDRAKVAVAKMPERFESFFEEKLALPESSSGE